MKGVNTMGSEASISNRIKELRNERNLTQKEFAELINVSTVSVSSYETGAKTPSLDMMVNISNICEVSIDWLCGLTKKKSLYNKVATYAEAFELLVTLCETKYSEDNRTLLSIISMDGTPGQEDVTFQSSVDINVYTFFKEWDKIYKLYQEKTIDEDLYNMWLEKTLRKYNVPIDGMPDFMH